MSMPGQDWKAQRRMILRTRILHVMDHEWLSTNEVCKVLKHGNTKMVKEVLLSLTDDGVLELRRVNNWVNEFRSVRSSLEVS